MRILQCDLSGSSEPKRIMAARVSASLFPLVGVGPVLGRTFTSEEDRIGAQVAVLSYGLWQRRFGAATNVIGKTLSLDRKPYTMVGVMPRDFQFPVRGLLKGVPAPTVQKGVFCVRKWRRVSHSSLTARAAVAGNKPRGHHCLKAG